MVLSGGSNSMNCFENFPVLKAYIQVQFPAAFIECFTEKIVVCRDGDVHFVDHRVFLRIVASPENRLQIGNVDAEPRQQFGYAGDEPRAVRAQRGNDERLSWRGFPYANGLHFTKEDRKPHGTQLFAHAADQFFRLLRIRIRGDEYAGELGLEYGLADILYIAAAAEKHLRNRGYDSGPVVAKNGNHDFFHTGSSSAKEAISRMRRIDSMASSGSTT